MKGQISNKEQIASVRRYTLTEGIGKGLDVVDCDNGRIRFLLNASKALDIMQLYHEGQNVSFISKNGFTKRETPFLSRFEGGMIYTCGLDSAGGREGYELHGTLHNIPAEVIKAGVEGDSIVVIARVRSSMLFGQNLVLERKITSKIGSGTLELSDTLINEGYTDANYCLLYHINIGYPMLDEGARLVANVTECTPRTDYSAEKIGTRCEISAPIVGEEELCYYLKLDTPSVSLVNEKIGKRFTLSYSAETLPEFLQWKSMAAGDYALGVEPCTTRLDESFRYKTLGANEKVVFSVSIGVDRI